MTCRTFGAPLATLFGAAALALAPSGCGDWRVIPGPLDLEPLGDDDDDDSAASSDDDDDTTTTPPPSFSLVIFGDNQFATTSCTSGVDERLAVPEVVLDLAPTFIAHTGDLMDHGYEDGAYDWLRACYADMLATHPFFPTSGNHDMGSGGISAYKEFVEQQLFVDNPAVWGSGYQDDFEVWYDDDPNDYSEDFDHPGDTSIVPSGVSFETFFAVRHHNLLLLSFEQGTRWWTNTPLTWVEDHLAAAAADPTIEHVIVTMHHPMYSTTMADQSDGEACGPVREDYEALFRHYDVTAVFSGHAHLYEHFYVPDDGTPTRTDQPSASYAHDGNAIHYVVTGGGGGPLPNGCDPIPGENVEHSYDYRQARGCGYHVTQIEVDGGTLTVSVIGVEGSADSYTTSVWDTFVIE